jgi:hypothetical protein
MRTGVRTAAALAALLAALAVAGCGDNESTVTDPTTATTASSGLGELNLRQLSASLEDQAADFLEREGSALRVSLHRFLGPKLTTKLERGSAVCRPGSETASISDPSKYPFACIVSADADGQGLQVGITLGFVGTEVDGRCWRAANDRVSVTTTAPALLARREAMLPVNQIAGCA